MPNDRPRSPRYAWYVVAVLMVLYVIAFLDRYILGLLVGPLKADLHLTDTQISLLQGLAFGLFYTFLGIPIGRIADSFNRRNLIVAGVAVWSLMTALCGLARGYPQLFMARLGVGVGEATLSPAAYSMIADSFPPKRMSLAMSIYTLGGSIGIGLGLVAGGALIRAVTAIGPVTFLGAPLHPWQLVFIAISTLGIVGVALMMTVEEPLRKSWDTGQNISEGVSFGNTWVFLRAHGFTFACLFGGFSCFILMSGALLGWIPSLLIRVYGWTAADAGYAIGITVLIAGISGLLLGGSICDRLIARGVRDAPLLIGGVAAICVTIASGQLFWLSSANGILVSLGVSYFFIAMSIGIAPAAVQMISPSTMRSQLSAIYISAVSLIGQTLGPTAVALCTDYVFKNELRVNDSLALTTLIFVPASGALLFWGRRSFLRSLGPVSQTSLQGTP